MTHLSYNEFTELMEKKDSITVFTNEGFYEFIGIGKNQVCVRYYFELNKNYRIREEGYYIVFDKIITNIEADSIYMSLK